MSLTWTIAGVDKSSTVRWREWALTECAERGQVGAATIILDDDAGTYTPPAMKDVTVDSTSGGVTTRLFTGYVAERSARRGPMAPGQRQWSVALEDLNVLLDDRIISNDPGNKRPAETDYDRVTWLLGTGAVGAITAGVVPNTNTVDMDKADYRGKRPRDVLEDVAQKSGKNFFVYYHASGPLLFYDRYDGTALSSTLRISDVAADVDSSTTFAPTAVTYSLDPARVFSKVRVRYKGGSAIKSNAATATTYRTRETYKRWMRVKTATKAEQQAQRWLDNADDEERSLALSVVLPSSKVNDLRAGQRVEIKITRFGLSAFVYWRVIKRTVRQRTDGQYDVELTLREKVEPTAFFGGPDLSVDEEMSNATDTDASTIIDEAGLTITGGAITVTNASGTVTIDGSSDFFSIVATGTLTIPRTELKGTTYQSVIVTTGVTTDPAALFFAKVATRDGKGDWASPLPILDVSSAGTVLRMIFGRARYSSGAGTAAKSQVQVARLVTAPPDGAITVRYYVLQKSSI